MALRLDYTNMMTEAVPGAISAACWDESRARRFAAAHADVTRTARGERARFLDLPDVRNLCISSACDSAHGPTTSAA